MVDMNEFVKEYENNPIFKQEVLDYFEAGPGMMDLEDD